MRNRNPRNPGTRPRSPPTPLRSLQTPRLLPDSGGLSPVDQSRSHHEEIRFEIPRHSLQPRSRLPALPAARPPPPLRLGPHHRTSRSRQRNRARRNPGRLHLRSRQRRRHVGAARLQIWNCGFQERGGQLPAGITLRLGFSGGALRLQTHFPQAALRYVPAPQDLGKLRQEPDAHMLAAYVQGCGPDTVVPSRSVMEAAELPPRLLHNVPRPNRNPAPPEAPVLISTNEAHGINTK